jgi:hypothetical protein
MPVIPATWEAGGRRIQDRVCLGKSGSPYLKNKLKSKRNGDVAQVVKHLSSKASWSHEVNLQYCQNKTVTRRRKANCYTPSFPFEVGPILNPSKPFSQD